MCSQLAIIRKRTKSNIKLIGKSKGMFIITVINIAMILKRVYINLNGKLKMNIKSLIIKLSQSTIAKIEVFEGKEGNPLLNVSNKLDNEYILEGTKRENTKASDIIIKSIYKNMLSLFIIDTPPGFLLLPCDNRRLSFLITLFSCAYYTYYCIPCHR